MGLEKLQITDNYLAAGMRRRGQGSRSRSTVLAADSGRIEAADYLMAQGISVTGTSNIAKGLTASSLAAALALTGLAGASGQSIPASLASPTKSAASGAETPHLRAWTAGLKARPSPSFADGASSDMHGGQQEGQIGTARPPTDAEIAARAKILLEHQFSNDEALEQYERVEHHVDRTGGAAPRVLDDKTYRVVPTGSGTMKLLLKDGDRPVDPAEYRKQLVAWKELLELMLKPEDSRTKSASAKWQKRKADRKELVSAAADAFLTKWAGQEMRNGRVCDIYDLQPNPNFHPRSLVQDILTRVTAKIWVDRDANQLSRGEAHVMRDISFGGGILGKLYRGGVFYMEQDEVAPGIWEATRYQYDFTARKFLFTFEQHQYIEARQYRRIGPPKQALAIAQHELASGKALYGDP
jgi:hypothetical protein